ncbi:hypothetical protein [Bifidobacterium longum]|uniref:hypothetical protein n=1 Tax=Bifidobacterium longum TaxID=216816 RepID=UPI00216AE6DC|nr:hypothetical protein [Bifidobacterium longum]
MRRGRMKRMIDRMLIYRTGTGLIVSEARVKGMHAAPPETIWRGYGTESRIPKTCSTSRRKAQTGCTHTVWKTPSATGSRRLCPTSD